MLLCVVVCGCVLLCVGCWVLCVACWVLCVSVPTVDKMIGLQNMSACLRWDTQPRPHYTYLWTLIVALITHRAQTQIMRTCHDTMQF